MHSSTLQTLTAYDAWATDKLLHAAEHVDAQQLATPSGLSHGTIFAVLTHVLNGAHIWRHRCQYGKTPPLLLAEPVTSIPAFRKAWSEETRALHAYIGALSDEDLESPVTYTLFSGSTYTTRVWEILMQVVNHGTHHRSEITGRLRDWGHSPGNLDFIVFLMEKAS